MRKIQTKLAALLTTVCCFLACIGVGIAVAQPSASSVTASAETVVRSITKIAATSASSSTAIYFYAYEGDEAKSAIDWSNQYTFVSDTGDGVKYNGETLTGYDMKQPGNDIYFGLGGKTAVAGDILTLDGTFRNETLDSNIVIDSGALTYNGSSWDRAYYSHDLGEMVLSWPSKTSEHAKNTQLYITPKSGETVPYPDGTWSTVFTYESGDGLKLNGSSHAIGEMKSVDSGLWFSFAEVAVGDIVSISGTYSCATEEAKYVLSESKFTWNGTVWENYEETPEVTYTNVYEDINLVVHLHSTAGNANANNTTLWLHGTGDTSDAWAYYTCQSGAGIKINGEAATVNVQDFSGGLYLKDFSVNEGDVISIGGTFVNEERATKYIIPDCSFKWNGSGWEAYVEIPDVTYTEYKATAIGATNLSNASMLYVYPIAGVEAFPNGNEDWANIYGFEAESGAGLKLNGEALATTDIKLPGTDLYIGLGVEAKEGDIITIDGAYSCPMTGVRLVFENCTLQFDGTIWETYVEYTDYTISNLQVAETSLEGGAYCANNVLSLTMEGGAAVPSDWPWFIYKSGVGFTVNGEAASLTGGIPNAIQDMTNGLYFIFEAVNAGDVVSIGGVFVNATLGLRYTIPESKFVYDGTAWKNEIDVIKATACAALEEYKANFSQENYYEAEWASFDTIIEEGKANIGAATTNEAIETALAAAKTKMDNVVTKEQSDAIFDGLKGTAKDELSAYKNEADYRSAEWALIQEILTQANAAIDASESVTAIQATVEDAKEAMDAVKTNAQWEADEAVVATAKAELAAYKSQSAYHEAEWTAIQAILTEANANLDAAVGNETAISGIVTAAKTAIDAVKTAEQVDAEKAVVESAKAELAAYKSESNYKTAQWTEIQTIITKANADIDEAIGDEDAIEEIVRSAKAELDQVKTAKKVCEDEVKAYYGALDHDSYSEEAATVISGYVASVLEEIKNATTIAQMDAAVAQFKANVEAVEKGQPANDNNESSKGDGTSNSGTTSTGGAGVGQMLGCGSVISGGLSVGLAGLAMAAVAFLRKKKDD